MLKPDIIYQPRSALEDALGNVLTDQDAIDRAVESLPTSEPLANLKGVVVRVKEVLIKNNRRGWPLNLGDRPADIYPVFLVANGSSDGPVKFELPGIFNGVRDNSRLNIGEPGLAIQRNLTSVPPFLDIHAVVMRSLQSQRDFAKALDDAISSNEGKTLIEGLKTLTQASIPGVAIGIATSLLQLYLRYLKAEKDKQIFYGVMSLERQPDGLGVGKSYVLEDDRFARISIQVEGVR